MSEMKETKEYVVNGQKLTESEFEEKRKEVESQKGMTLVEVSPGVYKIRIQES